MRILTLRTDKPEAEVGLYVDQRQVVYEVWTAHRQLAETLHQKIANVLAGQQLALEGIEGIVIYKGPGSFTGLRIGMSVANALAYSFGVPIVAAQGEWIEVGIDRILRGENDKQALPEYGAPAFTTLPRK